MERKSSAKKEKWSMKKSSPDGAKAKKVSKAKGLSPKREPSTRKAYFYHKLKDLIKEELDRINLYGVVMDCSGTYYIEKAEKYVCTIKLIDDTLNPDTASKGTPEYLTATMFAKTAAQLPQPTKIGSILRIHRGQTKENKGTFQINCDVNIKGAWTLFDPTDSVAPAEKSSKQYTFTPSDKATLKKIREFSKKYFENNELASIAFEKAEKERPKDFDTVCYVLDIKTKGYDTRVLLCDKQKVVKLRIPKTRTISFAPLMAVRLRSANFEGHGHSNSIKLNDYSNIVRVPDEYKSASLLLDAIKSKKVSAEVSEKLLYYYHDPKEPMILSHPLGKKPKVMRLRDLYSGNLLGLKDKYFRVQANVIEVGPKKPEDWICAMEKSTKKSYKLKEAVDKKGALREGFEYYVKLQLFVRDKSVASDNNLYLIYLCTIDGKGSDFIKLPGKKGVDQEYLKGLKRIYKMLTRPWATLDCIVEAVDASAGQPVFFLVDTGLDLK